MGRTKWTQVKSNFQVGDVVLLKEKNVARCDWRLAVIQGLVFSDDNLVRKVNLRMMDGSGHLREGERAIVDLIYLFSP